jgi:predicted CopG family antitoxin
MSWSTFNIRTHVKEAIIKLKEELGKSSYSDVVEYLIEFHRRRRGSG